MGASRVLPSVLVALALGPSGCGDPTPRGSAVPVVDAGATPVAQPEAVAQLETTAKPLPEVATSATSAAPQDPPPVPIAPIPPLPAGLKVLVIGDSFAQALGVGLKAKEGETGIKFVLRGEQATFIPEWAGPNKGLALLLKQNTPDLVVIALGGNELAMQTPEIRAPKVKQLVEILGGLPCVWVAPPLWGNKDNGLLAIIRQGSAPCRHFDSNLLAPDLPRGSDKIHPTAEGQRMWAGYFLDWLRRERDGGVPDRFALRPRGPGE